MMPAGRPGTSCMPLRSTTGNDQQARLLRLASHVVAPTFHVGTTPTLRAPIQLLH